MRALVTGGNGFIGRQLVRQLESQGWTVVLAGRGGRVAGASAQTFDIGLGEPEDFSRLLSTAGPQIIFHLAGRMTGTARDLYEANVVLSTNLLRALESNPAPPLLVLAGSAAEYGRPLSADLVSEEHPCAPLSDYGVSKHAQTLAGFARISAGLPILIARIFNPVGAGMSRHLALASFAHQLAERTDNVISVGDLDVERDFIDVREAARLIADLAGVETNFGRVFNICSGRGYNLRALVGEMVAIGGGTTEIVADPARFRAQDVRSFVGDTARLRSVGLQPALPDMNLILRELLADAGAATPSEIGRRSS